MKIGHWAMVLVACALLAGVATPPSVSAAEAAASKKEFKPGAACKRKTDDFAGVVKMDACHRVYCGRKDVKDIMEIDSDIGTRLHCTWQLVRDHCKCIRSGAVPDMTPRPQ